MNPGRLTSTCIVRNRSCTPSTILRQRVGDDRQRRRGGFTAIASRTTTVPRSNGPATAGSRSTSRTGRPCTGRSDRPCRRDRTGRGPATGTELARSVADLTCQDHSVPAFDLRFGTLRNARDLAQQPRWGAHRDAREVLFAVVDDRTSPRTDSTRPRSGLATSAEGRAERHRRRSRRHLRHSNSTLNETTGVASGVPVDQFRTRQTAHPGADHGVRSARRGVAYRTSAGWPTTPSRHR